MSVLTRLACDRRGTAAIEAALCIPLLLTMALGSFEVGMMVSKQQELQSGANEAQAIVLAAAAGDGTNSTKLKEVLQDSLGATVKVTLTAKYRCGTAANLQDTPDCGTERAYQFIQIYLQDRYAPMWTQFGVSRPVEYNVLRTVQVG